MLFFFGAQMRGDKHRKCQICSKMMVPSTLWELNKHDDNLCPHSRRSRLRHEVRGYRRYVHSHCASERLFSRRLRDRHGSCVKIGTKSAKYAAIENRFIFAMHRLIARQQFIPWRSRSCEVRCDVKYAGFLRCGRHVRLLALRVGATFLPPFTRQTRIARENKN